MAANKGLRADIVIDGEVDIDTVAVDAVVRGDNLDGRGVELTRSELALACYRLIEKGLGMAELARYTNVSVGQLKRFGVRAEDARTRRDPLGRRAVDGVAQGAW